jgi:redox-sensing transcriptional repressor
MRNKSEKISNAVIRRLPRYRRYLIELDKKGVDKISSKEFSELIGYTASQIRQDLNNFGGFGQQGYGYSVKGLLREISRILGLDKEYMMVIAGAGNLGQAITKYALSLPQGFKLCAIFEISPAMIGKELEGIPILDYENIVDYVEDNDIELTTRNEDGGVRIILTINGIEIINILDDDPNAIKDPGYLGIFEPGAAITYKKAQ